MLVYAARLDHATDVYDRIVDLADLEHMTVERDDVADVQVIALVRQVADRLAFVVDERVVEDLRRSLLHASHSTAAR